MPAAGGPPSIFHRARALGDRALVLVPLVIGAVVYAPILGSYFFTDDFLNFYHIRNYSLLRFLLTIHAGHSLVTRNVIWWVLDGLVGTRPEVYFATVLVTHLIAIALLFEVIRRLTGSARVACLAATLWGSAPVQAGSLAWYAVYGHVLVATIAAWFLYRFVTLRAESTLGAGTTLRWILLLVAASTSFGIGIGIAMALQVVAWLLLPPSRVRTRVVTTLGVMAVVCPVLYFGLVKLFGQLYGLGIGLAVVYAGPKMPGAVAELLGLLFARGVIDLLAGPLAGRIVVVSSAGAALVGGFGLVLAIVFARASARERRAILAGLVLAVACYAPIAAGRAAFFQRGLRFEQPERFQYAGTLALTVVMAVVLAHVASRIRLASALKTATVLALAGVLLVVNLRASLAMDLHTFARTEVATAVTTIRAAIDATPPGGDVYIENRIFLSVGKVISRRKDLFPGWAAIFVMFFPDNVVDGRRVYFVSEESAVDAGQQGRRTATLLVTAEQRRSRGKPDG